MSALATASDKLFCARRGLPRAAAGCLVEENDTVGVNPGAVDVDVAAFEQLAADGSMDSLERAAGSTAARCSRASASTTLVRGLAAHRA